MMTLSTMTTQQNKEYYEWVNSFDSEFRRKARLQYLEGEIKKQSNIIMRDQMFNRRLIENKYPKWFRDYLKDMNDVYIADIGLGKAVYYNLAGYRIDKYKIPKDSFKSGLSFNRRLKRLKSLIYEKTLLVRRDKTEGITQIDIERAKEVPITNYIEINKGRAICPSHNDHDPSLKIYNDTNTCYCFACQFSGDVIDIVMKIYNLDFHKAIKLILNK